MSSHYQRYNVRVDVRALRMPRLALAMVALTALGATSPFADPSPYGALFQADGEQAAAVRGRVEIGIPVTTARPTNAYPTRSVSPQAPLAPASERRNVVVYLQNAPSRRVPPSKVEIRQRNETFIPRVVAVTVGSEVEFPNDDPIYHNVFSLSRARTFNLGRYPRGQTRSVRFEQPGIVKVFCDIHSHMSATVMVFDHPWFAIPDEGGRFELPAVPPGNREITAWHERLGDTTVTVRVEPGRPAAADFVLPVPEQQ
jgi:plastocyanin